MFGNLLGRFFSRLYGDLICGLDQVTGDVDLAAVDVNVAMIDQLTGGLPGDGETALEDDIIQTAFQKTQQSGAGVAFLLGGLGEISAELAFENTVIAFHLLLLA